MRKPLYPHLMGLNTVVVSRLFEWEGTEQKSSCGSVRTSVTSGSIGTTPDLVCRLMYPLITLGRSEWHMCNSVRAVGRPFGVCAW
jgi:hypothetical protein